MNKPGQDVALIVISERLARIERAIAAPGVGPLTVSRQDALILTGHKSVRAFQRWAAEHNLHPCVRGKYYVEHVRKILALTSQGAEPKKKPARRARAKEPAGQ